MTYIELMNAFWREQRNKKISAHAYYLYGHLLNYANELYWEEKDLRISSSFLIESLDISKAILQRAQRELIELGLVEILPGHGRGEKTIYRLKGAEKGVIKGTEKGTIKGNGKGHEKGTKKGYENKPFTHYYNNLEYSNEYPKYEDKDKDKEKNIFNKNIQKENSVLSFDAIINQALSDNEKSWHDALLQKYGIKNLEQAIEDYKMHIELYPRQEPITSLSEFKRHFANIANNYPNFISEKAKQYKPVPIAVEFEQNGKRYVRQFGLEVLLPDNAPAKPTDSVSYYWDDTSLYWRRYG